MMRELINSVYFGVTMGAIVGLGFVLGFVSGRAL
jgi:hypothetical protein